MNYEEAKKSCHVRSAIFRTGDPTKIFTEQDLALVHPSLQDLNAGKVGKKVKKLYWKNHPINLDSRVPENDKLFGDWEEYDPREHKECSQYNEIPA